MPFVFPIPMPAAGPGDQTFEIERADLLSPNNRGRVGGVQLGFPLWRGKWGLGRLTAAQSDEWRAFVASLRGSQFSFLGHEFGREFPKAHPGGDFPGSFTGAAGGWSQTISSDGQATLNLTGLVAALRITPGDYVDFRWTTGGVARRSMVRSLESRVLSGTSTSFLIEPPVPALTPGSAVAHLDNPACVMKLIVPETRVGGMDRRLAVSGEISAIQDLRE